MFMYLTDLITKMAYDVSDQPSKQKGQTFNQLLMQNLLWVLIEIVAIWLYLEVTEEPWNIVFLISIIVFPAIVLFEFVKFFQQRITN